MTLITSIPAVIGTAGHVDHGKTALVKALTGIDTDTLKEEKLRGVSINLGFAHMDFSDKGVAKRIALVDVPGHEKFIKNMLAGTTGIDMALFAVAADDGIMPQTLEHFDIIRFLGVKNAVFAITKCDLVSEERIAEVSSDIAALLKSTILAGSPIMPVSSVTGKGMAGLREALFERLARRTADESGFFRMAVDRAFSMRGFGTVVTGTVASGSIKKGAEAVVFPAGERVKIRGLQSLHLEAQSVSANRRAALNINCAGDKVMRGDVITEPELLELAGTGAFFIDCQFEFSSQWAGKLNSLRRPKSVKLYHQASEVDAALKIAESSECADGKIFGRLTLKKPLLMLRLDRFILRDAPTNTTIGGGVVLVPFFSAKKSSAPRLTGGASMPDETVGVARILDYALPELSLGLETRDAMLLLNARPVVFNGFFDDKKNAISKEYVLSGGFVVNLERADLARKLLLKSLGDFHDANKTQPAMKEDALLKGVNLKPKYVLKAILDSLVNERVVRREAEGGVALSSYNPLLGKADAEIEQAVMRLFPSTGVSAVFADDIYKVPFKLADVKSALARLQSAGVIVRLTQECFITGKALNSAKSKLVEFLTSHASIKAAEFRDVLGCGRKLAIEILEYFDKEKVTLRLGDARTLRG